jgi:redox-sensitive bicupin YhaK (pirin superfamily)
MVGSLPVARLLPVARRRTVGSWCFLDLGGPLDAGAGEGGVGPHPHIGLQTVTWLFSGELVHVDGLGSEQVIRPGQLNLMTAGAGVCHAEEHPGAGPIHLAQMWVALPEATRHGPAAFEHHSELPSVDVGGATAKVLLGRIAGVESPARRDTDHVGAELTLGRRVEVTVPLRPDYEHVVVPVDAPVLVSGPFPNRVDAGSLGHLPTGADEVRFATEEPTRLLLLGGVPFPDEVVMWWNYVARSRGEIQQAHRDWSSRSGRFPLPASGLEPVDVGPPPWG